MMHRCIRNLALLGAVLGIFAAAPLLASASRDRSVRLTVSPAPGEVSLAQIAFPHAGSVHLSGAALEVTPPSVFGFDYLAVAVVRPGLGGARALVLIANRPSPLLDPSHIALGVRARGALGAPALRSAENILAPRSASSGKPGLCNLALHGAPLTARELLPLGGRGPGLKGLGGAEALAQAYDIACGLPTSESLRTAISQPVSGGCTPCDPRPGYACPLTEALTAVCAAPVNSRQRAAGAGTH